VESEDNRGSKKAKEQKRGEYAKTITQWVWKLCYLKDEETIVAKLMKAEIPTYNVYKLATMVELIVIDGVVPFFFFFLLIKNRNFCLLLITAT